MKIKPAPRHRLSGCFVVLFVLVLCPVIHAQGGSWTKKADMPTARVGLATCVVDGKIYAIGGVNHPGVDIEVLKTVEEYDPSRDSWTPKSEMLTSRNWTAGAVVSGKIYVIGGDRTFLQTPRKTMEEYDPASDVWTLKADMPTARSAHAAAVVDGKIYVIGGLTTLGAPPLATVEAYDPATDTWQRKANMPTPRGMLSASVVDGKIYVIGSFLFPSGPALFVVEMYDPQTDTWTRKSDMPTARGGLSCSTVGGRIYAIGGRTASTVFAIVEEYDPTTDTWTKQADMSDPEGIVKRFGLSTSVVNDRIYAIGGSRFTQAPYSTLSLTLQFTPSLTPLCSIRRTETNSVIVAWPASASGFELEHASNLNGREWSKVAAPAITVGEEKHVNVPLSADSRFYRLRKP